MAAGEIKEIKKAALTKLQQNLSWAKWAAIRKSCGAPVWKKKILEEIESSCCWAGVKATNHVNGAYLNFTNQFLFNIQTLNEKGLWRFHGLPYILCPIFGDGRSVWGQNQGWGWSIRSTEKPHSPDFWNPFAMAKFEHKENFDELKLMDLDVNFLPHWDFIRNNYVGILSEYVPPEMPHVAAASGNGTYKYVQVRSPFTADWNELVAVTHVAGSPKSVLKTVRICVKCSFNGLDKRNTWREGDAWRHWIEDSDTWNHARLWDIQPSQFVYEPLHNCARFTSNVASYVKETSEKNGWLGFRDASEYVMKHFDNNWTAEKMALTLKQTKEFFKQQGPEMILNKLHSSRDASTLIPVQWGNTEQPQEQPLLLVAQRLYTATSFVRNWATRAGSANGALLEAHETHRKAYIAIAKAWEWPMPPTNHYFLEHSPKDFLNYGAAFFLMQEQGEKANQDIRNEALPTTKGRVTDVDKFNTWEVVLRNHAAMQSLSKSLGE